uniref:Uncharacterized protein n=1 Tax=viral metagenome TaxID=1070528 RepID=A0A6C0D7A1_9ZZZZ
MESMEVDEPINDIFDEIKGLMKNIIQETNEVLKHSHSAFKKTKDKMINLERIELKPSSTIKQWLQEKNCSSFTIPDFFELLFNNENNKLDFNTKHIILCEKDALVLGFRSNQPISIYEIFERLPTYFQ